MDLYSRFEEWLDVPRAHISEVAVAIIWALKGYDTAVTPERDDGLLQTDIIAAESLTEPVEDLKEVIIIQVKDGERGVQRAEIESFSDSQGYTESVDRWILSVQGDASGDVSVDGIDVHSHSDRAVRRAAKRVQRSGHDVDSLITEYDDPFDAGLLMKLSGSDVDQLLIDYGEAPNQVDDSPHIWFDESRNSYATTVGRDEQENKFEMTPIDANGDAQPELQQVDSVETGIITLGISPFRGDCRGLSRVRLQRTSVRFDRW